MDFTSFILFLARNSASDTRRELRRPLAGRLYMSRVSIGGMGPVMSLRCWSRKGKAPRKAARITLERESASKKTEVSLFTTRPGHSNATRVPVAAKVRKRKRKGQCAVQKGKSRPGQALLLKPPNRSPK